MIGKTVYTVNNKTNKIDEWICNGEITGIYHGKNERLCFLQNGKKQVVLPKRCVYLSVEKTREVANIK